MARYQVVFAYGATAMLRDVRYNDPLWCYGVPTRSPVLISAMVLSYAVLTEPVAMLLSAKSSALYQEDPPRQLLVLLAPVLSYAIARDVHVRYQDRLHCYAMFHTNWRYAARRCPVLTYAMLLRDVRY
eukprot:3097780-Rhodomonas_salina.3